MSTAHLFDKYYYSRPDFIDGTTQFHRLCAEHIPTGSRILEIGAGPTNQTSTFLASIGPVVGVDASEEVLSNSALTEDTTALSQLQRFHYGVLAVAAGKVGA